VVHGDIKPQNVLIFKDNDGKPIAKLADFGYSTIAATEDEFVRLPKSTPWNAPEHHHRGFKLSAAKKTDAYSFGMLCLWVLFNERLSESSGDFSEPTKLESSTLPPVGSLEELSTQNLLARLKSEHRLLTFAHHFTETTDTLSDEQKIALKQVFNLTLVTDPDGRSSDFEKLILLLNQGR
jgi:serine/threonine protein kinase